MDKTLFSRPIWGVHGVKKFINLKENDIQNSMHWFDIYSFSHISHGIICYILLILFGVKRLSVIYIITIIVELLWEIFENTDYIIDKYRKKNFKDYKGDSIVNIIGDVIFTVLGVYIASIVKNTYFNIALLLFLDIILYPFKANFIHLSIGSLL